MRQSHIIIADHRSLRSSHFARGRHEGLFSAESSTSAEESQESVVLGQTNNEGCESTPSIIQLRQIQRVQLVQ